MMPKPVIKETSPAKREVLIERWTKLLTELHEIGMYNSTPNEKFITILLIKKKEPLVFWRTPWGFMFQYYDDWKKWYQIFEQREMRRMRSMHQPMSEQVHDNSDKSEDHN